MADGAVNVVGLSKSFGARRALQDVSFGVQPGEMVALLGASGSGKSTLMRQLAGLQTADTGSRSEVSVLGRPVQSGGRLAGGLRDTRSRVATIFQQFNLVERLPVLTNVMAGALHRLPAWRWASGRFPAEERQRAYAALGRVGIEQCAWQRASTLSGGQQQRAAISRALVQGAQLILADEPIASLDPESSRRVMSLLAELCRELGVTVLVSLHQVDYAFAYCPRTIALRDGRIVHDGPTHQLSAARLRELYGTQTDELLGGAPASAGPLHPPRPDLPGVPALQAA